ncbi:MAG TPA: glycoside hydrolase family 15 protein [Acidobacteriota bacterium]|nr:glycoside hydrolase family 15 protein [Acidobacteriota bacterium]
MSQMTVQHIIDQHLAILRGLQYESGLFAASSKAVGTGYDKSWLRDNFYECLAFEVIKDYDTVKRTVRALLDIFLKHEAKIDWAIKKKPEHKHEYIHARFHPHTFEEFWEEWGNKQNDSIGAILFLIGKLYDDKIHILQTPADFRIVQKLINYLDSLKYWDDVDSGMWEENEEIHASSVGACVAGLMSVKKIPQLHVHVELIRNGKLLLNKLLPRESKKKFVDLALLSLIYPYKVTNDEQTRRILENVEYHLVKERGVIRYKGDYYYNKNEDGWSEEAEWTFGFSWLAIIYHQLGNEEKAKFYEQKTIETINDKGEVPELYFSNSPEYNANTPLGWSESLLIVALYKLNKKHLNVKPFLSAEHRHLLEHFNR